MLQQSTLDFLSQLNNNNERDWFHANKSTYQTAVKDMQTLLQEIINELSAKYIIFEGTEPKKCMFRIFRDVRFSKDKRPYKPNFGAVIAPTGRKSLRAGFYIHIEPNDKSFWAGGTFQPPKEQLQSIRQEIDYNGQILEKILQNSDFKQKFPTLVGEQLKTSPKGYPLNHTYIKYLRYKSHIVTKSFKDNACLKPDFVSKTLKVYETIKPLNDFLNTAMGFEP